MCRVISLRVLLLTALLGLFSRGFAAETNVLLITTKPDHPFGSHMYAQEAKLLQKCLSRTPNVVARIATGWPPAQGTPAPDVYVFYSRPAGDLLVNAADAFQRELERGAGFVAIHWGTGVGYGKKTEDPVFRQQFQSWLGGWFRRPPCDVRIDRSRVTLLDRNHPITRGVKEETLRDEFYLNPVLSPRAQPLLQVTVDGQEHVVGWTYQRRSGRSVGITLGHFHETFVRPNFRRLLINSILWAAESKIPQDGADVTLSPQDVALPDRE